VFREFILKEAITIAIEFVRLINIYYITSVESLIAKHIKAIILANPTL
jgi:hypothetical protein